MKRIQILALFLFVAINCNAGGCLEDGINYNLYANPDTNKINEIVPIQVENAVSFADAEVKPEFPGGQNAMYKFLATETVYPPKAMKKGIEGKVFVAFVIETDGSVSNVKIQNGVDPLLDQEALRVVKAMPAWKPATIGGKKVRVLYQMPLNFKLN